MAALRPARKRDKCLPPLSHFSLMGLDFRNAPRDALHCARGAEFVEIIMRRVIVAATVLLALAGCFAAHAADTDAPPNADVPEEKPKIGKLPHVEFDVQKKIVRVECEALGTEAPLEFFCCKTGTNEYEAALRSPVMPSDLHTALLAVGLKPGEPVTYSEANKRWIAPHGPPLHVTMEYEKDGKTVTSPAFRWLRDTKTKKEPKGFTWVFTGSRVMPDGKYAADVTGYLVSVVNFDLTVIDIPELASSANETLEWERNPDVTPKAGTKVWMIIEPAGKAIGPLTQPAGAPDHYRPGGSTPGPKSNAAPGGANNVVANAGDPIRISDEDGGKPPATQPGLSDVHIDKAKVDGLKQYWEKKVAPHSAAVREAAQAHYDVISQLRREQQRLIDEADRIQRTIDQLEKDYLDLTTPHPDSTGS